MARKRRPPREFEAEITDLSHDGRGVCRIDGKVWFVDGGLPDESVRFLEQKGRRKSGSGKVVEVLKPSPLRIAPKCPHFGVCGGCVTQHLNHDDQVRLKQQHLVTQFMKEGGIEPETVFEPLTGDVWGYRRRARLGARIVPKKGGMLVGFRERHSSYITQLTECHTLRPEAAALLLEFPPLIAGLSSPSRVPQVEVSVGDHATALVFRHLEPLGDTDVMRLSAFGKTHEVQIWLQPAGPSSIHCVWPAEPAPLTYAMADFNLEIRFEPLDFIQVNGVMNERIVARGVELLELSENDSVLDLFCGIGNFTLPVATRVRHVTGVEGDEALVERARENARRNDLSNVEFLAANLYDKDFVLKNILGDFNKLLIDPPRSGALEVVNQLGDGRFDRVVYVSCNPATLARDASIMVKEHGYRMIGAGVADMFPHTAHIESIAVFVK